MQVQSSPGKGESIAICGYKFVGGIDLAVERWVS